MSVSANQGSVSPVQETSYLSRPEGRIGYDVAGEGPLVVLVPGMGDLRVDTAFSLLICGRKLTGSPAS